VSRALERSAALRLGLVGCVTPLLGFTIVAIAIDGTGRTLLDRRLIAPLGNAFPDSRGRDQLLHLVTTIGPVLVALPLLILLVRARWRLAAFWAVAVGGVLALDPLLKSVFERPSLNGTGSYSFPSGSAMFLMAVVVAFALLSRRRLVLAAGATVVLAHGAALVAARWHYPTDVLGGWLFALSWVTAAWLALDALRSRAET
jgi:undecaprenyl-diphosphatase